MSAAVGGADCVFPAVDAEGVADADAEEEFAGGAGDGTGEGTGEPDDAEEMDDPGSELDAVDDNVSR